MRWRANILLYFMALISITGCSAYQVIPEQLEKQVKKNVSFNEIEHSPSSYKGQMVVLGGEILSSKRLANRTQLEIIHLPMTDEYIPVTEDREHSQGRFYAYDGGNEIVDPTILPEGTPVTIVGEITGTAKGMIGESEQDYPTLRIKDLTKWDKRKDRRWARYPYYGGHYYGGHYWRGMRPFGFMYW